MPSMYCYSSEGRTYFRLTQKLNVDVIISVSRTVIGIYNIVHFTVAPAIGTKFTELDIIKLSSLFCSKQERVQFNGEVLVDDKTAELEKPLNIPDMLSH